MANTSKAQLIERAKTLGLKVGDDWTRRQIEDAIEIAEEDASVMQEDTDEALGEIGAPSEPEPFVAPIPEPPKTTSVISSLATPEPTPPTAPTPPSTPKVVAAPVVPIASSNSSSQPRVGAGRYRVLWTVTLPGGPVHEGEVNLNDAQARSLTAQGAVVHVDDYQAYMARTAATKAAEKPTAHPAKIPTGAGRYRTIGGVMRAGREIPHGTVADFTAVEVANLTKPGMIAIEYAD